ncbi:hypothetical protein [Maricaulis sp.]|uniref:nuclear transport factor 2 family protein n=1 Tax=Maricaulis sp. TaxID=1486257 RepID=UPI0026254435|nr:hypothetical protein [Maricaulis sp.]
MDDQNLEALSLRADAPAMSFYPPNFRFEVIRSFEDDGRLFMHVAQNPDGQENWVTMSLIGLGRNGASGVQHQVTTRVHVTGNPDHTMIGGPRLLTSSEETATSKAVVRDFVDTVLVRGETGRFGEMLDLTRFRTHNPRVAGGAASLRRLIEAEKQAEQPLRYRRVHEIVGCANFAAAFATIEYRGKLYEACDLFRVEAGLIVEHWDIAEASAERFLASNDRAI